ncbi:hypothetical protein AX15_003117 [Amanita polypyramis BW_CC]|nr:hypothetical protein AX15_003117 [Amanita polypyramis BW_CC]
MIRHGASETGEKNNVAFRPFHGPTSVRSIVYFPNAPASAILTIHLLPNSFETTPFVVISLFTRTFNVLVPPYPHATGTTTLRPPRQAYFRIMLAALWCLPGWSSGSCECAYQGQDIIIPGASDGTKKPVSSARGKLYLLVEF